MYSESWDFPGGLVVRSRCFHCLGLGSIPGWGTEMLQATRCGKKKKKLNHYVVHLKLMYYCMSHIT